MNRLMIIMAGLMTVSGISAGAEAQNYGRDQPAIQDQQPYQEQQQGRDQRDSDRRGQDSGYQGDQGRYDQRGQGNQRYRGRYARGYRNQGNGDARWHGDGNGNWDPANSYQDGRYRERGLSANDRVYHGSDGRYYCKRSNGTTGLVLGGVGGGLIGNALGGGTLGTLLGAGGGALLGKTLDQNHDRQQNRNNGYRCR